MRRRVPAAVATLVATACASEPPSQPPMDLADTQWVVEGIGGEVIIEQTELTLSFDGSGRVNGTGGCNRYFGDAQFADGSISFGTLGSTRMACPEDVMDQEQRFFAALESTRSYRQDELTGIVFFQDESGADQLRLRRMRKIERGEVE